MPSDSRKRTVYTASPKASGDAIEVRATGETPELIAKGITQYGSADLKRIQGRQSHAIADVLDDARTDYVIHRDDLVIVE